MTLRRGTGRVVTLGLALMSAVPLLAACAGDDEAGSTTTTPSTADATATSAPPGSDSSAPSTSGGSAAGTVQVFFSTGDGSDCAEVTGFPRTIDPGTEPVRAAFDALVAGPAAEEEAAGASSFLSAATADVVESTALRSDGLLVVDFVDLAPLIPNASTSCGSMALRAQLDATAFQFDDVERVRYRMAGSCDQFGNFLQTECFDTDRSGDQLAVPTNERASGSGCSPGTETGLPDGRWYGLVVEARDGALDVDLACWFTGTAAAAAAAEDGEESPPPNDYYTRNESDLVRTVTIDPGTMVTWYPSGGDPTDVTTVPYDQWRVDRETRPLDFAVWLTVDGGSITSIEEQWVP